MGTTTTTTRSTTRATTTNSSTTARANQRAYFDAIWTADKRLLPTTGMECQENGKDERKDSNQNHEKVGQDEKHAQGAAGRVGEAHATALGRDGKRDEMHSRPEQRRRRNAC